ncbi:thiolase family protein [Leptospira ilyithenensis]|uniref:Thiolase family protein n=1 Tax=Leptospira ilyithenensis TaxID=2484901 RepID=A0A4R9LRX4_9LEPT|nr:thiolase family protein [Leptospira ilyithenensis]TGN10898.1 thiolase family protein [Leptospira ilyithenensis]
MVVIVEGARTPFGKFGGVLKDFTSAELAVISAKKAIERSGVDAKEIEESIYGNVIQDYSNSAYLARHVALNVGLAENSSALVVNRLCGSGLEAIVSGARKISAGESSLILAGGVESMSNAPMVAKNARWGGKYGDSVLEDYLAHSLIDSLYQSPMGMTAENISSHYKISREEQDEWAGISQIRAEAAKNNGILGEEIIPVTLKSKKAELFSHDEHIRGESCVSQLKSLRPAFIENGTVTAGNASGINDGAGSVILASDSYAKTLHLKPLAKILGYAVVGCDPKMMGLGPIYAIPKALKHAGLEQKDIDLFEINEAYSVQALAIMRELALDKSKTNVNGGAVAIGHPLGASGTRVTLTLAYELRRKNLKYGVASLCIGGGQGIAIVIENGEVTPE